MPVELLGAARGGQRPGVQLWRLAEAGLQRPQRRAENSHADLAVALEARCRVAGDDAQLERGARGPGADQQRVVVDRHEALAPPYLLGGDLREQVAAHR